MVTMVMCLDLYSEEYAVMPDKQTYHSIPSDAANISNPHIPIKAPQV